jgi:hypothetical protein
LTRQNVANRQELTKVTVARLLQSGTFTFEYTPGGEGWGRARSRFAVRAECLNADGQPQTFDRGRLEDLKGRAVLQVNSHSTLKQPGAEAQADEQAARQRLREFIDATRLALEITAELLELHELGHFDYRAYRGQVKVCPLAVSDLWEVVRTEKKRWTAALTELRRQHYFINFFFSAHLGTWLDFLLGRPAARLGDTAGVVNLVGFVRSAEAVGRWLLGSVSPRTLGWWRGRAARRWPHQMPTPGCGALIPSRGWRVWRRCSMRCSRGSPSPIRPRCNRCD